jgi:prepilin-type N-terminal cleavage/methylation domain-containing protein
MPYGRGFTLIESVIVIAMLTLVAAGLLSMQPRVFVTQNNGRDQYVGLQILQACGERLLAVRRQLGYMKVTSSLCTGLGGLGGFASDPTVSLTDAGGNAVAACTGASCTAAIVIAKATGPAASLSALTLRLSAY